MASLQLWEGGNAVTPGYDCGGCKENVYPAPHRMAAHRRRSPYNLGGAFDPICDTNRRECYAQLVADDIVWLALVPEDSYWAETRVKVVEADAGGLTFDVVWADVVLDDGTLVAPAAPIAAMTGIATATTSAVWDNTDAHYTDPYNVAGRLGVLVGIQLQTLPAGGALDFRGRIELTVVARDFETVQVADCRINGSCVIDVPAPQIP